MLIFNKINVQTIAYFGAFKNGSRYIGSVDKYWGHRNKKHKKQPFGNASALQLSLVQIGRAHV